MSTCGVTAFSSKMIFELKLYTWIHEEFIADLFLVERFADIFLIQFVFAPPFLWVTAEKQQKVVAGFLFQISLCGVCLRNKSIVTLNVHEVRFQMHGMLFLVFRRRWLKERNVVNFRKSESPLQDQTRARLRDPQSQKTSTGKCLKVARRGTFLSKRSIANQTGLHHTTCRKVNWTKHDHKDYIVYMYLAWSYFGQVSARVRHWWTGDFSWWCGWVVCQSVVC